MQAFQIVFSESTILFVGFQTYPSVTIPLSIQDSDPSMLFIVSISYFPG